MNKVHANTVFCKEFDWETPANPLLFWVICEKTQSITHSINLAGLESFCASKGLTYRVTGLTEIAADGIPIGSPDEIELLNADGSVDTSIFVLRQHSDYVDHYKREALMRMDTVDMMRTTISKEVA